MSRIPCSGFFASLRMTSNVFRGLFASTTRRSAQTTDNASKAQTTYAKRAERRYALALSAGNSPAMATWFLPFFLAK
jgi:hypothetical protein